MHVQVNNVEALQKVQFAKLLALIIGPNVTSNSVRVFVSNILDTINI